MTIQGNNNIIDKLITGDDEIVFNLVSLIREQPRARLYTDGKSYLTAQSDEICPIWVYVGPNADGQTEQELLSVFSTAMKSSASLSVNAQEGFAEKILTEFANKNGSKLTKRAPLNAYYIRKVREIAPVGRIVVANEKYIDEIAAINKQATVDDNDGDITDEQSIQFAQTHANTGNLYLWIADNDAVVSMARIVRYGKFARITSVGTERAARGNGYAKMLVGELCSRMLAEGKTPVLYARSENASSNRCYRNIGFKKAGEICEFRVER